MERAAESHRRIGFWNTVLIYGVVLAALVIILKYIEYHYLIRDLAVEVYVGLVATLFTALGIWMGSHFLQRRKELVSNAPPGINEKAVQSVGLSSRELEVLQLIAEGNSNQEIADKLFISLATVKSHSTKLFGKLEVKRRTEAVHKAKSLSIIP